MNDKNRQHAINFNALMRLIKYSDARLHSLRPEWDRFIFTEHLLSAQANELADVIGVDVDEIERACEAVSHSYIEAVVEDIRILTIKDKHYPASLRDLDRPPPMLFLRGDARLLENRRIAVVGTREPTDLAIRRARRLAIELVEQDFTVVSGLANGIDTAAHSATMKAGGHTIAIIGTPIDVYYPKENRELQDEIADSHLLVSQFPLGEGIRTWNFPLRNRTMVGLSEATIIVEARAHGGGAKIQGDYCLKAGRKLFIMKSFVSSQLPWIQEFIGRGAIVFDSMETLLKELHAVTKPPIPPLSRGFAYSTMTEEC